LSGSGDKFEARIRDIAYNLIYKRECEVSNIKEFAALINELRDKGLPIDKAYQKSLKPRGKDDDWW